VGIPYYREMLFSALPPDIISDEGAPPVQVNPTFLSTLRQSESGFFYGKNTRGLRRNQTENTRKAWKSANSMHPPKFLSEKGKESAKAEQADPLPNNEIESLKPEAPAMYRNLEIKYSKFGVDDFDFG